MTEALDIVGHKTLSQLKETYESNIFRSIA